MEKVATRGQILWLKCTKFDFGWGSAPDPAGRAHSADPDPLFVLCNTLQYTILSNNSWPCICGSIVPPSQFPPPPQNRVLSYGPGEAWTAAADDGEGWKLSTADFTF